RRHDGCPGPLGATHAEPDNMHALKSVIEMPAQRADSAIGAQRERIRRQRTRTALITDPRMDMRRRA
ncbi:MAG TPA: hypothetical protein VH641_13845, partial [Streptosporangiaceae bacterium]